MSLNGDVMVMRNGRSTSTVSIYNYPEHLNPFYEDDQHKRLRFWHINKKGDGERRNSFSLGGIKDMWAFKSFRSKKKSSTLGINKTSESPPMLRREYQIDATNLFNSYDRRARYSSNGTATDGSNNNFERNATYRSSLQNVHSSQNSPNGLGLNRNDQYRSTIQFVGRSQLSKTDAPVPRARRYVYGGSVTPQPSRNSEFGRGPTIDSLTRGSSQTSVSTNPFDSDDNDEEETKQLMRSAGGSTSLVGKRTPHKKRRAPAPPVPIHSKNATENSSQTNNSHQTELRIEENLEIANLTAEIESFVKTTNDSSPERENQKPSSSSESSTKKAAPKTNGTVPKEKILLKTSPNMVITKEFKPKPKADNVDLRITEDERNEVKPALPEKKKINQHVSMTSKAEPAKEVGHVECIHVHVESPRSTPERALPSRVTSFKKEHSPPPEPITAKTSFTLASPPVNRRESAENGVEKQKVTIKGTVNTTSTRETETTHHKENGFVKDTPTMVKPPIAAKPAVESTKTKVTQNYAVIHKPSGHVVLSNETEELAASSTVTTTTEKIEIVASTKENSSPDILANSEGLTKGKPKHNTNQKHVVFRTDDKIVETVKLPEIVNVENKKIETIERTAIDTVQADVPRGSQAVETTSMVPSGLPPSPNSTLKIIEPKEDVLRIEEPVSVSSSAPSTSSSARTATRSTPHTSPRDEFEALYRNRPASHLEWKQSTLAPLEPHVPPEKRRSVKDIIESINRSQRLLHAAANKDLPLLSTTSQMPPPTYNEVVNQPSMNGHKDNDFDQSLKSLDETQREIERMFEEITAEDNSDEAPSPSCSRSLANDDIQKPNNEEIFKKCRVTKEVYDYRETSPTTSNLDWNPVPKPKRSKNLSDQREH